MAYPTQPPMRNPVGGMPKGPMPGQPMPPGQPTGAQPLQPGQPGQPGMGRGFPGAPGVVREYILHYTPLTPTHSVICAQNNPKRFTLCYCINCNCSNRITPF